MLEKMWQAGKEHSAGKLVSAIKFCKQTELLSIQKVSMQRASLVLCAYVYLKSKLGEEFIIMNKHVIISLFS